MAPSGAVWPAVPFNVSNLHEIIKKQILLESGLSTSQEGGHFI